MKVYRQWVPCELLMQSDTDFFETFHMFSSWSGDVHAVWM